MYTVEFRDEEVEVIVDQIIEERDVNYCCVEWHFVRDDLNKLELTDEEERRISDYLWDQEKGYY